LILQSIALYFTNVGEQNAKLRLTFEKYLRKTTAEPCACVKVYHKPDVLRLIAASIRTGIAFG